MCNTCSSALKLFTNIFISLKGMVSTTFLRSQANPIFEMLVNFTPGGTTITGHTSSLIAEMVLLPNKNLSKDPEFSTAITIA